jgi:hypothetical protein
LGEILGEKKMEFSMLLKQIRELSTSDYRKIGLRGNPAYSELHRGDDVKVHIPREPLEATIKSMIEYANGGNPEHIYLFSRDGGAGKSHTNRVMEEYCREIEIPFIIWDDDDEDLDIQSIRYLIHLAGVDRVVFLRECDAPKNFYSELLSVENLYIIGHGHEPEDELSGTEDSFKVFDLEKNYPFSSEDIQKLLREYIRELTNLSGVQVGCRPLPSANPVRRSRPLFLADFPTPRSERATEPILTVPDEAFEEISNHTINPGDALNMLGAMLAVAVYKAKNGKDPEMTDYDIQSCCNSLVVETLSRYESDEYSG